METTETKINATTAEGATKPIRVLLQTTIPATADDWHIGRFSLLQEHLASLKDEHGQPLFEVTARNRESNEHGTDPVLSTLDQSDFDELWLFAVDKGDGITVEECEAITAFRTRGGGILATRDHQDLGSSLCILGGVGPAHYFHSKNFDPDEERQRVDDNITQSISWPNYHSGANGNYQRITALELQHPLLHKADGGVIELFPAHPHEGGVGVPVGDASARVVATGTSQVSQRYFNLMVALESDGNGAGRGIAESSFHHFVDYNWDTDKGCPSFVEEKPGDQIKRNPQGLDDIKTYVRNAALWLAGK
jgi:hypothetical protein